MPFTLLAHQSPVVPLKWWRPRLFSGTALVLGSMAPDFHYVLLQTLDPTFSHSIKGQFFECLPLTLILWLIIKTVVAAPLSAHLPDLGKFHLRDYRTVAAPIGLRDVGVAIISALIASFSHIAIDGFSHKRGFAVAWFPSLTTEIAITSTRTIPIYFILQFLLSIIGIAAAIWQLHFIGKRRLLLSWHPDSPPPLLPTRRSHIILWTCFAVFAVSGTAYRLTLPDAFAHTHEPWFWGHELLQTMCFATIGMVLGCVIAKRFMRG